MSQLIIDQIGNDSYNNLICKLCKELHQLKLKIEPLFKAPSDDIFREEIMKEYVIKLQDDEMMDMKITLCDIALDTILS